MKAGERRITDEMKFVVFSLLQMFGKDAIEHIWGMYTNASGAEPNLRAIMQNDYGITKEFKFDNSCYLPNE